MKVAKLITATGEEILIEAKEMKPYRNEEGREISASDKYQIVTGRLSEMLNTIETFANDTVERVKSLSPDEVELKFGLNFSVSEGKLISLIAQCGGEANIEVTLKWQTNKSIK